MFTFDSNKHCKSKIDEIQRQHREEIRLKDERIEELENLLKKSYFVVGRFTIGFDGIGSHCPKCDSLLKYYGERETDFDTNFCVCNMRCSSDECDYYTSFQWREDAKIFWDKSTHAKE